MSREKWSSSIGFILAGIGSAVGIGNIWRFPYIAGANGGGAFLIPYFIAVFMFGLPLMMLEFALGRHFKTSVVPAFSTIGRRFRLAGFLPRLCHGRDPELLPCDHRLGTCLFPIFHHRRNGFFFHVHRLILSAAILFYLGWNILFCG